MQIRKIDTANRSEARRFVQFPNNLYRRCPQWVPYPPADGLAQLNPGNAYFQHSEADFFVAEEGDELLGRICVMENRSYNQYHQASHAFFYLFDTVNDLAVARGLFEAATAWAKQRGLTRLVGPKGFVPFDGIGMLYRGFEYLPAMGVPYNFAYYNDFLAQLGFEKEMDFTSFYLKAADFKLPERVNRAAEWVKIRRHLRVKSFSSKTELRRWIPKLVHTYNQVFINNWEYSPVSAAETQELAQRMLQIVKPQHIKLILDRHDNAVGFLLTFLDISRALQQTGGKLFPLGWFKLLTGLRNTQWVNINGMGILEEYRGLGGNAILYAEMEKTLRSGHFEHADLVQMADTVDFMLADMTTMGVTPRKVHRVYRLEI
jgi:GNAT superfamily N-acetyltransferase